MDKEVKRKFRWGFTWDIAKLEKWMSDLSAKGTHIIKPGKFWNTYTTDPSTQYIYRIDFQLGLNKNGKLAEYTSLYADSGWEYIGSIGPLWHYFRKNAYAAGPHELYTDRSSLVDYYKRIRNVLILVAFVNLISLVFNAILILPKYQLAHMWSITVPLISIQLFLVLIMIYGYLKFGQKIKAIHL